MVRNPLSRKEKDLPPPKMTTEELDELLAEHFDGTYRRQKGIDKEFCEHIGGVPTVDEDGSQVCTVLTYKNPETPDVTVTRKIKIVEA